MIADGTDFVAFATTISLILSRRRFSAMEMNMLTRKVARCERKKWHGRRFTATKKRKIFVFFHPSLRKMKNKQMKGASSILCTHRLSRQFKYKSWKYSPYLVGSNGPIFTFFCNSINNFHKSLWFVSSQFNLRELKVAEQLKSKLKTTLLYIAKCLSFINNSNS